MKESVSFRSPWSDPNVKAALKDRPSSEISLIRCPVCGNYGYYNDGCHFTCSCVGCDGFYDGDDLDVLIGAGEMIRSTITRK